MTPYSYNNSLANLMQQGFNLFGGNNMYGFNNFGMNNAYTFTNCFGETNYEKMNGYAIGNALLGVTSQAIASSKANKEPEVNYTKELNNIAQQIQNKNDEITSANTKLEELSDSLHDSSLKGASISSVDAEISSAETNAENLKKEIPTDTSAADYKQKMDAYKEALKKVNELKEDKDTLKNIETQKEKIEALNNDLDKLEKKQADLQAKANDCVIADSKSCPWQRADKDTVTKWAKMPANSYDIATKKELNRASYEFRKGDNKKEAADAFVRMYESNKDEFKKDFEPLYNAIKDWQEKNK